MIFCLLACAGANDSAMCHEAPTYDAWTKGFLKSKCQGCHAETAPDRFGAPEGIYFDTYDATVQRIELIRSSILERETMPPAGGVTDDEKLLLQWWLDCPY